MNAIFSAVKQEAGVIVNLFYYLIGTGVFNSSNCLHFLGYQLSYKHFDKGFFLKAKSYTINFFFNDSLW